MNQLVRKALRLTLIVFAVFLIAEGGFGLATRSAHPPDVWVNVGAIALGLAVAGVVLLPFRRGAAQTKCGG